MEIITASFCRNDKQLSPTAEQHMPIAILVIFPILKGTLVRILLYVKGDSNLFEKPNS